MTTQHKEAQIHRVYASVTVSAHTGNVIRDTVQSRADTPRLRSSPDTLAAILQRIIYWRACPTFQHSESAGGAVRGRRSAGPLSAFAMRDELNSPYLIC